MKRRDNRIVRWSAGVTVALCLAMAGAVRAQAPAVKAEDLAGAWEGISKGAHGDIPVRVDLRYAEAKFSGEIVTATATVSITGGSLAGDMLTLSVEAGGTAGTVSAKVSQGRLEGTWQVGPDSGSVVLTRAAAAPAVADPISGEWNGEAVVQGGPMPITLFIKVAGEAVTGEIMSPMGRVPFTSASWKDGVLTLAFPYAGGEPVTMGGRIQDGTLVGVFDYNGGEIQGTWTAVRK